MLAAAQKEKAGGWLVRHESGILYRPSVRRFICWKGVGFGFAEGTFEHKTSALEERGGGGD